MSHSRKVLHEFSQILLDGRILNTNTSGNLTLNSTEIASGNSTAGSFDTLVVNDTATFGNVTVTNSLESNSILFATMFPNNISFGTQGTSITTAVTDISSQFGSILTVSSTLAAGASAQFDVQHGYVYNGSKIITSIVNYSGTGIPHVHISNVTTSLFSIVLSNLSSTDSLNAPVEIGYVIFGID